MTFSIQNNPYYSMYPHMQYSDPAVARKALALRQNLNARLQGSHGMELLNNLLATYACSKFPPQDMSSPPKFQFPPLSPLFSSPGLFQQALASAFQPGLLPLPRQFAEDLSVPPLNPRSSEAAPPAVPKLPKRIPPSPAGFKRKPQPQDFPSQCDRERMDSILYCQPTFYPILKDQVEKTHQSLRTTDAPKLSINSPIQETGVLVPSLIDGEIIMGFNVWGEKRLCLPHLFRFVLNDVDLKAIDEACTKLQITCTTCTPAQLTLLHSRKILPKAVSSCGLIRKSDAERLTKFIRNRTDKYTSSVSTRASVALLSRRSSQTDVDIESSDLAFSKSKALSRSQRASPIGSDVETQESSLEVNPEASKTDQPDSFNEQQDSPSPRESTTSTDTIPVIHECFGRQLGFIHSQLYTEPSSKCIECRTCHRFFAPDQFVGHTHTVTEVDNLNHWGFDSNNWRCYLRLYTGRCSRPGSPERTTQEMSEDESSQTDSSDTAQVYRRLEEFKIKFAQPIRLPASLSAALRTVGLCASIAPIPPALMTADAHPVPETPAGFPQSAFTASKSTSSKEPCIPIPGTPSHPPLANVSPMSSVMLPQLTLRRLWAPNDGRIRVPPPPKPLVTRDSDALPKRLQTGPPLLLHSHRVVSQAAAERYDRDFIPNVCLMPPLKPKLAGLTGRYGLSSQNRFNKRRPFRRNREASSGSRSCSSSAHSSGSSSSRTRSVSVSSTSSSSCSYERPGKRHCNGLSSPYAGIDKPGRHSSSSGSAVEPPTVVVSEDKCKGTRKLSLKWTGKTKPRSRSWAAKSRMRSLSHTSDSARSDSVISLYDQQLYAAKRRRCRSLTVPINPCFDLLAPSGSRNSLISSSGRETTKPSLMKEQKIHNEEQTANPAQSCRSRKLSLTSQQYRSDTQWQDRAMAAAKAAQGMASRTCPGLWSRHFTNLNGSNGGPLNLPNAREPLVGNDSNSMRAEHQQSQSRAHMSNTPVLVTSPTKNSLPTAVLALEAIWADLVRHINEYTAAVESRSGVLEARQRLFEQFITMQTCYATHIATLVNENQKLLEKLATQEKQQTPTNTSKSVTNPQTNSVGLEQDWNRNMSSMKQHLASYASAPQPTVSTPQVTSQSTPLSVFPHRSRKESTRTFPEHRAARETFRFGDSGNQYSGCTETETLSTKDLGKRLPTTTSDRTQHRFVASPNYTTSSSDDTNQASTTPTASETDGLLLENSNRYNHEYPNAVESRASELPLPGSPPYSSISGTFSQPLRGPPDDHQSNHPEPKSDEADSRSMDGNVSFNSTIHRRHSLLPPCEGRPRMSLKPHSRLLTRS